MPDDTLATRIYFRSIAVISFDSPIFFLRAIYPDQSLLLLGLPSSFNLLNWNTKQRTVVAMLSEEEEELVSHFHHRDNEPSRVLISAYRSGTESSVPPS